MTCIFISSCDTSTRDPTGYGRQICFSMPVSVGVPNKSFGSWTFFLNVKTIFWPKASTSRMLATWKHSIPKRIVTWSLFLLRQLSYDYCNNPDLSNRTVRQSNPIEHQSFDCWTQSNIIEFTIKFCQSNTIERSITQGLVIEPNRTFDYRTIGIIERSINGRRIAW